MDLHRAADKVSTDVEHMHKAIDGQDFALALAAAKRGRRDLTLTIRLLAEQRDNELQPEEA